MPLGWYLLAVCYGAIVFLLGWYPWNILLMLLLLPRHEFSATQPSYSVPAGVFPEYETPR
jgi:hypothetical protein